MGSFLIAGMHALIEFFLATNAIMPMLHYLQKRSMQDHGIRLSSGNRVFLSIRTKLQISTITIGTFPLLLIELVDLVRFTRSTPDRWATFIEWAVIDIIVSVVFSLYASVLLSRNIQQPIATLVQKMRSVEHGTFDVYADELYVDEFSKLASGFNHMVGGLVTRNEVNNQLTESYFATLAAALDARDPYTAGHSLRVAHLSIGIGQRAGLSPQELGWLRKSALLHDIGKIGVRDDVLLKEGKLSDEELRIIQAHPVIGEAILLRIQPSDAMAPLLPGVRSHHERYDGKGYPDGLRGNDIPTFGRIMAVADAFDAMTSDRPYRSGMPVEKALSILREGSGSQWDPLFVTVFLDWISEQPRLMFWEQLVPVSNTE